MPAEAIGLRFLADMGVSTRVVDWLRSQGHDAVHLRDEGFQRLEDERIFAKAADERQIILTFDLDFGQIAAFSTERALCIVVFRLHNTRTSFVIDRLAAILAQCGDALRGHAVILVEDSRHRIRFMPIGEG